MSASRHRIPAIRHAVQPGKGGMLVTENHIRQRDRTVFCITTYPLIGLFALLCIVPFYLILVASFTSERSIIMHGYSFFPREFSLESYALALKNPVAVVTAYRNTIFVTCVGTFIAVTLATMSGFVLSRRDFAWRNQFTFFFFFTMLFSGGLVPWYIICTRYLGFRNRIYALILPGMFSTWNMIIAKNFMRSIPVEIIESAKMDGANDFVIFLRLIVPVSKPLIATLMLFTALAYWNDWFNCMLFITRDELTTLQYFLQQLLSGADQIRNLAAQSGVVLPQLPIESMKMAMTVIVTGPILLLYPFLQKYFIKGLTIGSVKG